MATTTQGQKAVFRVLDAMDAPHGGRLLKLRFQSGEAPRMRELKGATLRADSPDGQRSCKVRVDGFAVFGGRPSDDRIHRTGRVDVHVSEVDGDAGAISHKWSVAGPLTGSLAGPLS